MMKKILLGALTAALLLSLTSCSQLLSDALKETERPGPIVSPTGNGQDTPHETTDDPEEPTEPTEPVSTGVDAYGFTIWPEGNYLADPKFDTDEFLPDYDVENGMSAPGIRATVCSTPETVYAASCSIKDHMYYSFVGFADKSTGIVAPLCGRPECTHDDKDCNAYAGGHAYGLRVYDGKLWWVTTIPFKVEPELRCMELDGTNHETVATLENDIATEEYMIHRGYVYAGQLGRRVLDGKPAFSFNVVAYSMDDGSMITILDQVHAGEIYADSRYITLFPVGNDLIILLSWGDKREDGEPVVTTQLYRWSSKTRKAELLYSAEKDDWDFVSKASYATVYPAGRNELYFVRCIETEDPNAPTCIRGDRVHDGTRSDFTLMLFTVKTGEFEEVSSFSVFNGSKVLRITRNYIAVVGSNQDGLLRQLIYDYDGNLLSVSDPIFDYTITGGAPIGGDEDYFYRQYGFNSDTGIEPGILAVPVHGGDFLDINNTWEPQL